MVFLIMTLQTRCLNAFLADSVVISRKRHNIKTLKSQNIPVDEEFSLNVSSQNNTYILSNNVETGMKPTLATFRMKYGSSYNMLVKPLISLIGQIWIIIFVKTILSNSEEWNTLQMKYTSQKT